VDRKIFLPGRQAASEVKKDKIAALKKTIMEGTYQVKSEDIASKILKESLFKILLSQNRAPAGAGLAISHSCPPTTEVFDSPDSPADARIMNSRMFSNFPHPLPLIHIGKINLFILSFSLRSKRTLP